MRIPKPPSSGGRLIGWSDAPAVTPRLKPAVNSPLTAPDSKGSFLAVSWLSTGAREPSARPNPILSMLRGIRTAHTDLQRGYCDEKLRS